MKRIVIAALVGLIGIGLAHGQSMTYTEARAAVRRVFGDCGYLAEYREPDSVAVLYAVGCRRPDGATQEWTAHDGYRNALARVPAPFAPPAGADTLIVGPFRVLAEGLEATPEPTLWGTTVETTWHAAHQRVIDAWTALCRRDVAFCAATTRQYGVALRPPAPLAPTATTSGQ